MGTGFIVGSPAAIARKRRVAFFGGSFDPPHLGHVAVAREAQKALELDEVWFGPVGRQPLKIDGDAVVRASFEDRVEMTSLAIAGYAGFSVSLIDAPNADGRPNYTIDTLTQLRSMLGDEAELFLLLGADAFRLLPRWFRAAEVPFLARLVVVSRPGESLTDLGKSLPAGLRLSRSSDTDAGVTPAEYIVSNSAGKDTNLYLLHNLQYDISATQLREQMQANRANLTPQLLNPAVLAYIGEHNLYQ